jgi:hypothetical protein
MRIRLLASIAFVLFALPAAAQTYFGAGKELCQTWSHERSTNSVAALTYEAWAFGFISGVNATNTLILKEPDFLEAADADSLAKWIDGYCASHPSEQLMMAAIELVGKLRHEKH